MTRAPTLLICLATGLLAWPVSVHGQEPPPNIVIIYADDLGWRDLGVMGSNYYETPNIDRLAGQGMRFTHAYSNAPNCAPSRASLLSGQYAPRHGIYTVLSAERGESRDRRLIPVRNRNRLDPSVVTIAEALGDAGYRTGHIGKWHLGDEGFAARDQGFDVSIAGTEVGSPPTYFAPYRWDDRALPDVEDAPPGEYLTDRLTDEAMQFIRDSGDEPFFLYLSHYAVHTPLEAKPELVEYFSRKPASQGHGDPTYAGMVRSLDDGVGRLLDLLDELDLRGRTVVIFTSDNGGYGPATSMAPLRGSKGMLYEGGIRVPLIVRWPGVVAPGVISEAPVVGLDLYATLLAIGGAGMPLRQPLDGVSLVPLLRRERDRLDRPLFWHFPAYLQAYRDTIGPWRTTPVSAVRLGRFKLLHFFEDARDELYDLANDVSERVNIAALNPEKADELRSLLRRWWSHTNAFIPTEPNPGYVPPSGQ